jgi:hypothetical protein
MKSEKKKEGFGVGSRGRIFTISGIFLYSKDTARRPLAWRVALQGVRMSGPYFFNQLKAVFSRQFKVR